MLAVSNVSSSPLKSRERVIDSVKNLKHHNYVFSAMAHAHQHTAHGTLITAPFRSLRQVIECEKYGKHGKSENFLGTKN